MNTGLTINNPGTGSRWDSFTSTTECGLWAGRVLQAEFNAGGRLGRTEQALSVLRAYLKYGYDYEKKRYYGRLNIADGAPILGATAGDDKTLAKHQPGDYADWKHSFFPIHDYPLQFAEACLAAYRISGETEFKEGAMRWAESLIASRAEPSPATGIYAEHYGRCSHFLNSCGRQLSIPHYEKESCSLLKEAAGILFDCGMFRTHPGEHRYDAVDGLGFLILSMIAQETGKEPDMMGASW